VSGQRGEQLAQDARRRRLADGDRPGDADDERRAVRRLAEERRGGGVQLVDARDVEVEQPRQRQVDLLDLVQVDPVAEAAQPVDVGPRSGVIGVLARSVLQTCRSSSTNGVPPASAAPFARFVRGSTGDAEVRRDGRLLPVERPFERARHMRIVPPGDRVGPAGCRKAADGRP
jgi:hypothetical protein